MNECFFWSRRCSRKLKHFVEQDTDDDRGGYRGRVEGVATPPFGKISNLSGYPCLSLFHIKNNIISYNIRSGPIDHYKKTVASPLLDSLIIQMQDRFSVEDQHARHLLCLVSWMMKLKACCSGRKTFRLSNPLEMRKVDGKHSVSQQIGSLQTTLIL